MQQGKNIFRENLFDNSVGTVMQCDCFHELCTCDRTVFFDESGEENTKNPLPLHCCGE